MGRPINKKYFANTNYQDFGTANVGGESVATVAIAAPIAASLAAGTTTVTFSAPQLTNGVTATGTAVIDGNGDLTGITITNVGSGYTSVPTISVVDSDDAETLTLTSGSGGVTITLTTTRQNSIKCEAQIGAGSEVTVGDIVKQVGSKRYKVTTANGTAVCKLVQTADLNANEMSITATDANSNAYFIRKLTARTAIVERKSSGSGDFATGAKVKWTFGSATSDTVSIENQ